MNAEGLNNYFVDYLKNMQGNIKILLMSHNSDWPHYAGLLRKYPNLEMDFRGSSTDYLTIYKEQVASDYDIIALKSNNIFMDKELNVLETLALDITKNTGKKVIVAYKYYAYDKENNPYYEIAVLYYDNKKIKTDIYTNDLKAIDDHFMDIVLKSYNDFQQDLKVKNKIKD